MPDDTTTTIPPWPGEEDPDGPWDAETVMRWLAGAGCAGAARSIDLLPRDHSDQASVFRYFNNLAHVQQCHDMHLALGALRQLDPAKADEIAHRVILAAVAGDGYGEWLWQWADEAGLAADAICAESRAKIARERESADV